MSQDFYLIDKGNKTFYSLGGGSWYALNDDLEALTDLEYLEYYIIEKCYCIDSYSETKKKEIIDHVKNRLVPDLCAAFGQSKKEDLIVVDDSCDDLVICKAKQYRCVGIRYFNKDSKDYIDRMLKLNSHLEDTDLNKRWYNPAHYTKYAEWEKY